MIRRASVPFFLLIVGISAPALSKEHRWGISVGFGGTGLEQEAEVEGVVRKVQRSEGPGVFVLFAERQYSSGFGLTIEHARGFRLGPFSSGASFTGVTSRWYFFGPAPLLAKPETATTFLMVRRYAPFAGFAAGLAEGAIARESDQVPSVNSSGVFIGGRFGADYQLALDMCLRGELSFSRTIASSKTKPSSMSEFSIRVGWIFPF